MKQTDADQWSPSVDIYSSLMELEKNQGYSGY